MIFPSKEFQILKEKPSKVSNTSFSAINTQLGVLKYALINVIWGFNVMEYFIG